MPQTDTNKPSITDSITAYETEGDEIWVFITLDFNIIYLIVGVYVLTFNNVHAYQLVLKFMSMWRLAPTNGYKAAWAALGSPASCSLWCHNGLCPEEHERLLGDGTISILGEMCQVKQHMWASQWLWGWLSAYSRTCSQGLLFEFPGAVLFF